MSGLARIQTDCHSDGILEKNFLKKYILTKNQQTTKSMKNYPACKALMSKDGCRDLYQIAELSLIINCTRLIIVSLDCRAITEDISRHRTSSVMSRFENTFIIIPNVNNLNPK